MRQHPTISIGANNWRRVGTLTEAATNLLGILETNFSGLSTRKDRSIRKSKSTFDSKNNVIDLKTAIVVLQLS